MLKTPSPTAPEHLREADIDAQADLFTDDLA